VEFARPSPVYTSVTRRSWRQLDLEVFRVRLQSSLLCNPDVWPSFNFAVLSTSGIRLTQLDLGVNIGSFEIARLTSVSSTLSCLTTDCCSDVWSSLVRLQSTRQSLVAHGGNLISKSFVSVCSHRYSATLTYGHRSTSLSCQLPVYD